MDHACQVAKYGELSLAYMYFDHILTSVKFKLRITLDW